jgi:DNA-binding response OmpR family regulator
MAAEASLVTEDPDIPASPVILVIDGDQPPGCGLQGALSARGFRVLVAGSGDEGMSLYLERRPDAVVVSSDLPDLSTMTILGLLREIGGGPVIVVSRSDDEEEAISALNLGATDVLSRPDRMGEWTARIQSAVRSVPRSPPVPLEGPIVDARHRRTTLSAGPVEIDLLRPEVRVRGQPVSARPKEIALLEMLVAEAGRFVSRERSLEVLWPDIDRGVAGKRLDVHIRRVRHLIEEDVSHPNHVITLRGQGHRFDPEGLHRR